MANIDATLEQNIFYLPKRQWIRFHELLRSPFARRMLRHIEVDDPAPIVGKDNQHEQHSQSRRGYLRQNFCFAAVP